MRGVWLLDELDLRVKKKKTNKKMRKTEKDRDVGNFKSEGRSVAPPIARFPI
jgi:hypothetical protein